MDDSIWVLLYKFMIIGLPVYILLIMPSAFFLEPRLMALFYTLFPSIKENDERLERESELEKEEIQLKIIELMDEGATLESSPELKALVESSDEVTKFYESKILRSPEENKKVAARIYGSVLLQALILIVVYGESFGGSSSQLELIKDQAMRGLFSITYTPQWNIWFVWACIVSMVLDELRKLYDTEHVQKGQKALDVAENIVIIPFAMAAHDAIVFLFLLENPITPVSINYLWWGQFDFTFYFILGTIF